MPLAPVQVTNTHAMSKRDSSTSAGRLESNKYSVRIAIFSLNSNDMKPFIFGSDFGAALKYSVQYNVVPLKNHAKWRGTFK